MSYKNLLLSFLLGGSLFVAIYYVANILKNPDLSAIISLLPLSIICCYIIKDLEILKKYTILIIPTILITALVAFLLYVALKLNINKYITITLALLIWIVLQYIRVRFIRFKNI